LCSEQPSRYRAMLEMTVGAAADLAYRRTRE
jgi:hypothetical protein